MTEKTSEKLLTLLCRELKIVQGIMMITYNKEVPSKWKWSIHIIPLVNKLFVVHKDRVKISYQYFSLHQKVNMRSNWNTVSIFFECVIFDLTFQ